MTEASDNMRFYSIGAEVPKEACKDFKKEGGFSGTDINRMWRVAILTKMFGPVGTGWTFNLTEIKERAISGSERVVLFATGELRYKDPDTHEWSEAIIGYGGNDLIKVEKEKNFDEESHSYKYTGKTVAKINDEAYKMVETDAFGSACSKLGIGASVYWKSGWGKYISDSSEESTDPASTNKTEPQKITPPTNDPFFTADKTVKSEPKKDVKKESPATVIQTSSQPTKNSRATMEKILDKHISKYLSICVKMNEWLGVRGYDRTLDLSDSEFEQMLIDLGVLQ